MLMFGLLIYSCFGSIFCSQFYYIPAFCFIFPDKTDTMKHRIDLGCSLPNNLLLSVFAGNVYVQSVFNMLLIW